MLVVKQKDTQDLGEEGWLQRPEEPRGIRMAANKIWSCSYGVAKGVASDKVVEEIMGEMVASGATSVTSIGTDSSWVCVSWYRRTSSMLVVKQKDTQDLGEEGWLQRPEEPRALKCAPSGIRMAASKIWSCSYGVAKGVASDKVVEEIMSEMVASGATSVTSIGTDSSWVYVSWYRRT
ncbi:hypothetical protein ACLOJK_021579 [Asimina triloba]